MRLSFNKQLSDFQEIFLHSIVSRTDTFAVVSTGVGKTVATGIAALLLREVFKEPLGLVVMFIPLSGILDELVENDKILTAGVNMKGMIYGKNDCGRVTLKEERKISCLEGLLVL